MSSLIYPLDIHGFSVQVVKTPEYGTIPQTAPNGYTTRIANRNNPIWHFHLEYNYVYDSYPSQNNRQFHAPYTDIQYLIGWFMRMKGNFDDFLFSDPTDFSGGSLRGGLWQPQFSFPTGSVIVARAGHSQQATTGGVSGTVMPLFDIAGGNTTDNSITWKDLGVFPNGYPNTPVVLPLVNNGAGHYYSPVQRLMGGLSYEDVTDLNGNIAVFANGVLQNVVTNYAIGGPGLAISGNSFMGLYIDWVGTPTPPITAVFNFYFRLMFEEDTQDFERWGQQLWTIGGTRARNGSGYVKLKTSRVGDV